MPTSAAVPKSVENYSRSAEKLELAARLVAQILEEVNARSWFIVRARCRLDRAQTPSDRSELEVQPLVGRLLSDGESLFRQWAGTTSVCHRRRRAKCALRPARF
jgi:hypothetical protein